MDLPLGPCELIILPNPCKKLFGKSEGSGRVDFRPPSLHNPPLDEQDPILTNETHIPLPHRKASFPDSYHRGDSGASQLLIDFARIKNIRFLFIIRFDTPNEKRC